MSPFADEDGAYLLSRLKRQAEEQREFPFSARDRRQLARKLTVRTLAGEVAVEVPDDEDDAPEQVTSPDEPTVAEARRSIQMQAKVAQIGVDMASTWPL